MTRHVEVLIVGAGFAGVATALALRAAGHDVAIVERGENVGGTWRDNRYPGVACDVPAHVYSLRTHPNPSWSREYAPGEEIRTYLEDVVAREGIDRVIRFGTALTGAAWDGDEDCWRITLSGAEQLTAEVLVMATGRLSEPHIPLIPGLATFPGPVQHTARWDPSWDPCGRRVAVVGTGASAIQLVPELVRRGAHVTLFQRTPAWVLPRGGRVYTDAERHAFAADPAALAGLRSTLMADDDERFAARSGALTPAAAAVRAAHAHRVAQVPDPVLRTELAPRTPFGCRRVLLSDDYYPTLASDAVDLEPSALADVEGGLLRAASGRAYRDIDMIALATGFDTSRPAYAPGILGAGGESLAEHWTDGMSAAASTVVSGFPNLFLVGGPHSALSYTSSLLALEAQALFVRDALAMRPDHGGVLRVDAAQEAADTAAVRHRAAGRPWTSGCRTWYTDERNGNVSVLWPGTIDDLRGVLSTAVDRVFDSRSVAVTAQTAG